MKKIEQKLLDPEFDYFPPFFYRHPLSYRLELSLGTKRSALRRARQVFDILFSGAPDAIVFNYRLTDLSESGGPEEESFDHPGEAESVHRGYVRGVKRLTEFLLANQLKYRHAVVRGTSSVFTEEDGVVLNNRVICWSDGRGFDNEKLIKLCVDDRFNPDIGFVSFENECVMLIYDDRGCDIVFADEACFLKLYEKLEQYFLEHDRALMEKRREEAKKAI
ncbi:MAG: DUF3885 domain-containing protein [Clostridiales bacterium]|nr:DUF3885 domain-containing protein [Clostridiales bacterium]